MTPAKSTSSPLSTLMDECFGQVARALRDGTSGPEAFALFLRLLGGNFDHVDLAVGYKKLRPFRVPKGSPFAVLAKSFTSLDRQRQAQCMLWPPRMILV